jgi:hypothetical protein
MIASAEDEQTEECDATASQNNESPSETGDSDADPNYSLSDASYSDTSDNNSYSFDEINVSALSEPQNTDLTTEDESRNAKSKKRKRAMPSEWKRNYAKLLRNTGHENRTIKRGTEIPERKIPRGATGGLKCFSEFSERKIHDIIKRYWSLGNINAQRILSLC